MRRICRRLYEDGIPSPTGNATWSIACLSKMLTNSTYKGRAVYNRHQALPPASGRKSTRNTLRPPEEWIEIPVPAIVSEEVFDAAQRVSRDHTYFSPRRTAPGRWLLRRLVVCGHCGVKTYCQDSKGRSGRTLRYYVCNRRRSLEAGGPDRACPQPSTRAEALEGLVWDQLRQALLHPETLRKGQAVLGARMGQPDDELLEAQQKRLDRRLQQTEGERRRVVDLYQMQAIERSEFQTRHREVVERHRQLQQEREALVTERKALALNHRLAHRIDTFAERVRHGMDALDFEQRQRLMRLLIEQVRVTGPIVQIHLRIPLDEPPPPDDIDGGSIVRDAREPSVSSQVRLRSLGGAVVRESEARSAGERHLHLRLRSRAEAAAVHHEVQRTCQAGPVGVCRSCSTHCVTLEMIVTVHQ
jgi:site-specific DNA recombinase